MAPSCIGSLAQFPSSTVIGPPSSDPESVVPSVPESDVLDNIQEYQYQSEGKELLGESARRLYHVSDRDYRCESFWEHFFYTDSVYFSCMRCITCIHQVHRFLLHLNFLTWLEHAGMISYIFWQHPTCNHQAVQGHKFTLSVSQLPILWELLPMMASLLIPLLIPRLFNP